jgi:hypothetical protein
VCFERAPEKDDREIAEQVNFFLHFLMARNVMPVIQDFIITETTNIA